MDGDNYNFLVPPQILSTTRRNFNTLHQNDLVTLLRGCKDLMFLDARNLVGFDESDEEFSNLASKFC